MKNILISVVILLLVVVSVKPVFHTSFFPLHDFTHVARLVELDKALKDGHFPVRWTRDFGYGYGMPLFNFYGPLPFYVAEIFMVVGLSAVDSVKLLLVFFSIVAAVGMYKLASELFGQVGGIVSTAAFLFIPYRALDLFVRGAFNEIFAISLVPWILYAFLQLRKGKNKIWIGLTAIALSLLFLTHNLMTLMFLPILYIGAIILAVRVKQWKKYLVSVHAAMFISILISAFFLLPSFFEKGFTQVDKLIGGYGNYAFHFLYIRQLFTGTWGFGGSILGIEDGVSFNIGTVHIVLAALGTLAWFLRKKRKESRILLLFVLAASGVALFLTIFKSQFVWQAIPIMQYFQFPWRFLSVTTVTVPLLAGATMLLFRKKQWRVVVGFVTVLLIVALNVQYFEPKEYLEKAEFMYYTDANSIQESMSGILPDYIPVSMKTTQLPFQKPVEFIGGDNNPITTIVDRTQEKLYSFNLTMPATLIVRIAWFPNWTVYDYERKISFDVNGLSGFLEIPLEKGEHMIGVKFEDTPLRTFANLLTVFGVFTLAGVTLYGRSSRSSA